LVVCYLFEFILDVLQSLWINQMELHKCLTKLGTDALEHISIEVEVLVLAKVTTTEGALQRKTVNNLKLTPTDNSSC